jgi:hypothetical protein
MAFLFCMTMIGGSFAATPLHHTSICQDQFFYSVHVGDEVKVKACLLNYGSDGVFQKMPLRYLDFGIYDDNGTLLHQETVMTSFWLGQWATVTINPEKWNLSPGNYKLKIKYTGCTKTLPHLAPCQTGWTYFSVY